MNIKKYIYGVAMGVISLTMASCYNNDKVFDDYAGGTTAYFAYQFPVRTLFLGNDIYDNSLDNAHKIQIWSTMGGAYGGRDAVVDVVVDKALCENLYFVDEGGNPVREVQPMPEKYYQLMSNQIPYNGNPRGYVEVQLTDDFFKDSLSVENTYVIPLKMVGVKGIDRILVGEPRTGFTPVRQNWGEEWKTLPQDFTLYCVRYINPWHAKYIRRGVDEVTEKGATNTVVRKDFTLVNSDPGRYNENPVNQNDEVCSITTKSMTKAIFPVSFKTTTGNVPCNLILTFDGNKCVITTEDPDVTVSGTGEFITNGSALPQYKDYQWGNLDGQPVKERDILRLSYTASFKAGKIIGKDKYNNDIKLANAVDIVTNDTLVGQTRESNQRVFFTPKYVKP